MDRARRMVEEAVGRFRRAREEGHRYWMRDAAIRAWNAVLQATDALLAARGLLPEGPVTPLRRRQALARLEREDPAAREARLRERLASLETLLYRDAFHDLEPDPEVLGEDLEGKARAYLEAVASLLERPSPGP